MSKETSPPKPQWTFLTNHFHILVVLERDPTMRISDMAIHVGITQRAVQRILAELAEENILKIKKDGRRNVYSINKKKRLKHDLEKQHTIGDLLNLLR